MILVVTGSGDFLFKRLLNEVDAIAPLFKEPFIMQIGQGSFIARHCSTVGVIAYERLMELYKNASVVVAHASSGPLIHSRQYGKPVVMIARNPDWGEIIDDHQQQLTKALASVEEPMRCVLADITGLEEAIRRMQLQVQLGTVYRTDSPNLLSLQQAIRTVAGC